MRLISGFRAGTRLAQKMLPRMVTGTGDLLRRVSSDLAGNREQGSASVGLGSLCSEHEPFGRCRT
jgi:hypothetical protein